MFDLGIDSKEKVIKLITLVAGNLREVLAKNNASSLAASINYLCFLGSCVEKTEAVYIKNLSKEELLLLAQNLNLTDLVQLVKKENSPFKNVDMAFAGDKEQESFSPVLDELLFLFLYPEFLKLKQGSKESFFYRIIFEESNLLEGKSFFDLKLSADNFSYSYQNLIVNKHKKERYSFERIDFLKGSMVFDLLLFDKQTSFLNYDFLSDYEGKRTLSQWQSKLARNILEQEKIIDVKNAFCLSIFNMRSLFTGIDYKTPPSFSKEDLNELLQKEEVLILGYMIMFYVNLFFSLYKKDDKAVSTEKRLKFKHDIENLWKTFEREFEKLPDLRPITTSYSFKHIPNVRSMNHVKDFNSSFFKHFKNKVQETISKHKL